MDLVNNNTVISAELSPVLNVVPSKLNHIHMMGICGTGMASLAGILKQRGYVITGSDENVYPPMSLFLERLSIPILKGYRAENIDSFPDLVIVGNVITRFNPEAVRLSQLQIPYLSLPQALREFAMKDQRSIVVSGTHGKTTTTAIASWLLEHSGMEPGFMIGGIPVNFEGSFKLGKGKFFVIEGDEYDTAFFDKGPKFLHYAPWVAILTNIEFDHADIYRDLDHVTESFQRLIELIPSDGLLIANHDDPVVREEVGKAKCPVITYGLDNEAVWQGVDITIKDRLTRVRVLKHDNEYIRISTPLFGRHNILNLLSVIALSDFLGVDRQAASEATRSFRGIRRRQEIKGEKAGVLVMDDFAHHPTAVEKTIQAVKDRYADHRLVAVFEPRSNSSRRNIFQERYSRSFDCADLVLIPEPPMMGNVPKGERFSSHALVRALQARGLTALYFPDTDHLLRGLLRNARSGDLVLIMSNGSFDNLHERLLKELE
jgi:UDP-N-acetylmuramate: L-alanyl-gamma-D-glutamyl-meso-diaminopimelate ligase